MDEGFKKIEFENAPPAGDGSSNSSQSTNSQKGFINPMKKIRFPKIKFGKKGFGIVGVVIVLFLAVGAFLGFKAYALYNKSQTVYTQAKKVADAARAQYSVSKRGTCKDKRRSGSFEGRA